jgi:hypothetical protein
LIDDSYVVCVNSIKKCRYRKFRPPIRAVGRFGATWKETIMRWPFSPLRPHALRAEILLLGARHQGEPLAGAVLELADVGLSAPRRRLLEAVVRKLRPASTTAERADLWPTRH